MRWIALGAMLLAGCLGERTTHCPGGYICPDSLACAAAPVYCGKQEEVAACEGKQTFDTCAYTSTVPGACYGAVCFPCDNDREGCGPAGWYAMTPATVNLYGVWADARGDAYAVGDHTRVLHYDGTGWVGADLPIVAGDVPLAAVWSSDPANVFAVGQSGIALHYDGAMWSVDMSGSANLRSLWGAGPRDVYTAGYTQLPTAGIVRHWDGTAWTTAMTGTLPPLYAIGGSGPNDIYAAGKAGTIVHFDGSSWTTIAAFGSGPDLDAVWARGPGDVLIAGGSNASTILHLVGGTSQPVTVSGCGGAAITALWGTGSQLYAAGLAGCLLSSSDGAQWSVIAPPPGAGNPDLHAIAGSGPDDVFAVGAAGAIWHSNGS